MDVEHRRKSAERSRIIGEVYAQWYTEQAGQLTPDPQLAHDPAYSEHAALISASAEAEATCTVGQLRRSMRPT